MCRGLQLVSRAFMATRNSFERMKLSESRSMSLAAASSPWTQLEAFKQFFPLRAVQSDRLEVDY